MRVHMMTPTLTTGDAIGNYVLSLKRIWRQLGVGVQLYADYIDSAYRSNAWPTSAYRPTGRDVLWFHYSIWSDNFAALDASNDFKVMDYHGVTPPHLAADYDPRLAALCRKAIEELPAYSRVFDWCIYHAEDGRRDLERAGYASLSKVRLPVSSSVLGAEQDADLSAMLRQLEYMLFVGRIVPQKDVIGIVRVFAQVHQYRPQACLFLVGGTELLPGYVHQVRDEIGRLGLEGRVRLTGKVSDRVTLGSLYRHAKFLITLSEWESFCVPVVEAMSFGAPVIHGGGGPVAENVGDAGIVVDKADPARAGQQIAAVWADSKACAQLEENARRRSRLFTEEAAADDVRSLLCAWQAAFSDRVATGQADHSLTLREML